MSFQFKRLSIPDVVLIDAVLHQDGRGCFWEGYKRSEFAAFGINSFFVQENRSVSSQSVLRGLHYQKNPKAQGKLVQVLEGTIFDVAVDIRFESPTYRQWVGVTLSAEERRQIFVPVGFAHGFCVISETAQVTYKVTEEYSPQDDAGILWNDPDLSIPWPIHDPILSKKDAALPRLNNIKRSDLF